MWSEFVLCIHRIRGRLSPIVGITEAVCEYFRTILIAAFTVSYVPMNLSEFFQALTLWFVVMIFLQTESGIAGPASVILGVISLVLLWAIPAYLLREIVVTLLDR